MSRHPDNCNCRLCRPEIKPMKPIQVNASGAQEKSVPPGVHVLEVARIGTADRDACLERLRQAYGEERLDSAEMDARQEAALAVRTKEELDLLVRDLPAADRKPASEKQGKWEKIRHPEPVLAYFIFTVASAAFPLMAAIAILTGNGGISAAVLAMIGTVMAICARALVSDK